MARLFDTGVASREPLADGAIAQRAGWQLVPEDNLTHRFIGDCVFLNDKVAVVLRRRGVAAEVHAKTAGGFQRRASVAAIGEGPATTVAMSGIKIVENNSGAVMIEAPISWETGDSAATSSTAAGNGNTPGGPSLSEAMAVVEGLNRLTDFPTTALRFRLTTGEAILEIRPNDASSSPPLPSLSNLAPFLSVRASSAPVPAASTSARAPSTFVRVQSASRYVVVPDFFGDDLVFGAEAFRGRGLPAENFCLHLLDGGDAILMTVWQSSDQEVWLGETRGRSPQGGRQSPGAAEVATLSSTRIGCLKENKIWLAFFESPAIWRAAGPSDKVAVSFPAKWRSSYVRENGVCDSWDTERGPSPGQLAAKHAGPLVVYPIDRTDSTPLTAILPTDVMRNTLGVGPCQYILAVEGLSAEGDPTPNNVMNWIEKQFEQKKETKAADDIKERLDQMNRHVAEARTRIERYGEFAAWTRNFLSGKSGAEPYTSIVGDLSRFVEAGTMPTVSPERTKQLAAAVLALIGKENAPAECRRIGKQLRAIGVIQDGAMARCRMAVRRLKQEGRTVAANQPHNARLAQEVQRLAGQMLQKK